MSGRFWHVRSIQTACTSRIVPDHPVRIVTVKATPHRSGGKTGGGSTGPNCDGFLRIATNRLDLPAELIGEIYRLRWLIENFFRMFKQLLGCRHLLSTKQNGVEIQVYCGIIACLLIMLYTGRQPTTPQGPRISRQHGPCRTGVGRSSFRYLPRIRFRSLMSTNRCSGSDGDGTKSNRS